MSKRLNIVIYGATGFTGEFVTTTLYQLSIKKKLTITWGIAGRSQRKLNELLQKLQPKTEIKRTSTGSISSSSSNDNENNKEDKSIPTIIADIHDMSSLQDMASKAEILINCTGPYRLMGEPIIKACLKHNTNYIDITAEPVFMERVQLRYHNEAHLKNVHIISACGIESLLSEMGVIYVQNNFTGTLNSIETYLQVWENDGFGPGPSINIGTWQSLVYAYGEYRQLKKIRAELYGNDLPELEPKLKTKKFPCKSSQFNNGWTALYPGPDRSVMRRSQRYFYDNYRMRPIQLQTYLVAQNIWQIIFLFFASIWIFFFCSFEYGRQLMINHPRLMSAGFFGNQPSKKQTDNARYIIWLNGEGWEEEDCNIIETKPINRRILGKISGNSGYRATGICAVLSALVLHSERNQLPVSGGVYTPGVAFRHTTLMQQLIDNGIKFEILQSE